jgi:hypothetical protein
LFVMKTSTERYIVTFVVPNDEGYAPQVM